MKSSPDSPELGKAREQQKRLSAAIKKKGRELYIHTHIHTHPQTQLRTCELVKSE